MVYQDHTRNQDCWLRDCRMPGRRGKDRTVRGAIHVCQGTSPQPNAIIPGSSVQRAISQSRTDARGSKSLDKHVPKDLEIKASHTPTGKSRQQKLEFLKIPLETRTLVSKENVDDTSLSIFLLRPASRTGLRCGSPKGVNNV